MAQQQLTLKQLVDSMRVSVPMETITIRQEIYTMLRVMPLDQIKRQIDRIHDRATLDQLIGVGAPSPVLELIWARKLRIR